MNEKKKKIIKAISRLIIILMVVYAMLYPGLTPRRQIRANILELTHIGSSMDLVNKVIEENGNLRMMSRSNEHGYLYYRDPSGTVRIIGERFIKAQIGPAGLIIYLTVSWGFDENGILIDIYVERHFVL